MSMPETGFFFPGPFDIPHPEDGEQKIHLNGWMEMECTITAMIAIPLRTISGCPSTLSVDSLGGIDWNGLGEMEFLFF